MGQIKLSKVGIAWPGVTHSSRMTYGGFLHPRYSFAGLASCDVAAGDRFFLATKIVIITLNDAKIIQPLVCGWQAVVRGLGNPATLSIL
jgi:hypothetical protein